MKTNVALQLANQGKLEICEVELPAPQDGQVVVKLFSSGVCHSQLHQMHNANLPRPMALGHEATGVVVQVGKSVNHVKEGDHVIVTWVRRTPVRGMPVNAPSGATYKGETVHGAVYTLAEDVLVDANYVVPILNEYPTDVTCIIGCAVLTGAGAVLYTAKVQPGQSVAVYGVGGVGLCTIQTAAIVNAYPIIAVDLSDDKLAMAKEFGATHTVNASNTDPIKAIHEITGGGADFAFDAIGVRITNEQILPSTRAGGSGASNQGGVAVLIGLPNTDESMAIPPRQFVGGQRQYRGSLGATYPDTDFPMFLRWFKEGKFPLDKLVTQRYPLSQVNEAYTALQNGDILGRAIIEY
ncbi:MAG: alcohol dehydrogenase [Chloroflexi bacterium]|nr:alcohol dehydrogenase [Chloroflexota bacterium]